jgi:transposase
MLKSVRGAGKLDCFAAPPWTAESEQWQALDQHLPADHLARRLARAVELLDLGPLWDSYLGVGSKALRPDLLLKAVLYEMQSKRPSPAQWAKDARESEPVRWLLFGMEPSRTRLYEFRDRVSPFLGEWLTQALQVALHEDMTAATRTALDSTSIAAHAGRRRLLNDERLQQRRGAIAERLQSYERGEAVPAVPYWLAKTEPGLRRQKERYDRAAEVMRQRQEANARRRSSTRKPADKVLVSPTDPEAALARDKENVFRPLYTVQLLRDLDSPLVFGYQVMTQNNDNDVLQPMVEQMVHNVGLKPRDVLVDSGYVSMRHLEFCAQTGITLYGPCQQNDFSVQQDKKPQRNQHTELPKSAFVWLEREQAYQCPEGHRLPFAKQLTQARANHCVTLSLYVCPAEHCQACPRQAACTRTPKKGRTVSRMANEELLDALRQRMQTTAAKELYRLRSRTVELNYADMKEHRGIRRFHGRGLERVQAEIGLLVIAHTLVQIEAHRAGRRRDVPAKQEMAPFACAA